MATSWATARPPVPQRSAPLPRRLPHLRGAYRVHTRRGLAVRRVLDRPLIHAAPVLLEEQVPVHPGDVLLEAVVPLPAQTSRILRVPQAHVGAEVTERRPEWRRVDVLPA